jgi:hypothetical protein
MINAIVMLRSDGRDENVGYHQFEHMPMIGHMIALEGFSGAATVVAVIHHASARAPHTEIVIEP